MNPRLALLANFRAFLPISRRRISFRRDVVSAQSHEEVWSLSSMSRGSDWRISHSGISRHLAKSRARRTSGIYGMINLDWKFRETIFFSSVFTLNHNNLPPIPTTINLIMTKSNSPHPTLIKVGSNLIQTAILSLSFFPARVSALQNCPLLYYSLP